jgi:hypothetical protein
MGLMQFNDFQLCKLVKNKDNGKNNLALPQSGEDKPDKSLSVSFREAETAEYIEFLVWQGKFNINVVLLEDDKM